jgi:bifunctional non-homologous end joining protein LigD
VYPAGRIHRAVPPHQGPHPPSGQAWLHEIKHDGFRIIARKHGDRVRLYSRPGNDLTYRFPPIVETLARLHSRSCIIDGEAVCCDDNGVPSFDRLWYRRHDGSVFLYAFDLIELDGEDLRRDALEVRKATLASVLARAARKPAAQRAHRARGRCDGVSAMRVSSGWKASSASARTRPTAAAARRIG